MISVQKLCKCTRVQQKTKKVGQKYYKFSLGGWLALENEKEKQEQEEEERMREQEQEGSYI